MIQFNLVPSVKLEYLKTQRIKRVVIVVAAATAAVALTALILLFLIVVVIQKKHLNDLSRDIKTSSQKLQGTQDLNKILTIQNQLGSLTALHDKKPVASRLFNYVSQITPNQVSIAHLDVDFDKYTLSFEGSADAISTINKFVDTLKFTTYKADSDPQTHASFSNVVLTSFGRTDKGATYKIDLNFDPIIFDSTHTVTLTVPQIITTRSTTEQPSVLFQPNPPTTTKP